MKSRLCKRIITIIGDRDDPAGRQADERNKRVTFSNCAPLFDCIREVNNAQVDNAKDLDVVIPMYNFIDYNDYIYHSKL